MATVVNRTSGEIRRSVHTPGYPAADWLVIEQAAAEAMRDVPVYYRVVEGDAVREATVEEKAAVDQERLPLLKEAKRDEVGEVLREALRAADNSELAAVMASASTKYGAAVAAIEAATTATALAAISVEI